MKIIGHRGSGGHAPPSSAPAIQKGLEMGATAIELEIQFASDSTPVVFHDKTLERAAGVNGSIRNQDLRELGGYDVGFRFGDRYRGIRLLTLEEALEQIPENVDIHIDIKDFEPVNAKHLRGLLAILKRHGGLERCLLLSTSSEVLATLGTTDRKVRRGLRTSGARSESVEQATALGCTSLHPDAGSTRRALVDTCRKNGLGVFPHSAHDGRSMRSMVDLDVDGLSTDHPDRLLEIAGGKTPRRPRRAPTRESRERTTRPAARSEARESRVGKTEPSPEGPIPPEELLPVPETVHAGSRETPEEVPATPTADDAGEAAKKRRRRGRRGGKREQARRARRTRDDEDDPGSKEETEIIPLEPVEDEAQPLELLGEIHAELDREASGETAATDSANGRKRRRRGRRGGKRVQARRQRTSQSGDDSDS